MKVISCSFSLEHNLSNTISHLQKCSNQQELKQIHAQMLKTGSVQDSYTITKFLSLCVSSNFLPYAILVFNSLDQPNTFLWNLMIKAFSISEPEISLLLYNRMLSSSTPHNDYTFPFLLKACSNLQETVQIHAQVIKFGYGKDLYAMNSLVNSYVVNGNLELAYLLFNTIFKPDVVSWTSMISGYVKAGLNKEALRLFQEMQNSDVEADDVCLSNAISACANLGALEQGRWIHSYVKKRRIRLDSVLCCVLIDMYAKCGDIKEALRIFKSVKKRSVQVWTALISGYGIHGHGREAISKFMEMQKMGIKPNVITFTAILTACSYTGLVEEGKSIFYSMERDYNVKPTIEHYGCVVDLLGRNGLLDEAKCFIQEMPLKPNAVIWSALLKACRIHNNIKLGEEIGQILIAMDPNHGGRYVHMASVHAMAKKWDKVAQTRRLMKERGVVKVPGCSMITLEGITHEFLAGDRSQAVWLKKLPGFDGSNRLKMSCNESNII